MLKLVFISEEEEIPKTRRDYSPQEKQEILSCILNLSSLCEMTRDYVTDTHDEHLDMQGKCIGVFNVINDLIKPIKEYLSNTII